MADSGICYTWSGDKKIYEPDLFSAESYVASVEYCHRYDSKDSKTLVFGKDGDDASEGFSTYLPYGGISIVHNIQPNGEDHYSFTGTYTKSENWSPPAGVDGPFDSSSGLKYPYYHYFYYWTGHITTWYNGVLHFLDLGSGGTSFIGLYYGNKE